MDEITGTATYAFDPTTEEARIAFEIDARIRDRKQRMEAEFVWLGKDLAEMRDRALFRALGCETFEEYLARPELGMSRATAYMMIAAADVVEKVGLSPTVTGEIGHVKLAMIRAPILQGKGDTVDWLHDASTLSRGDLRKRIREADVSGFATDEEKERAEDFVIGQQIVSFLVNAGMLPVPEEFVIEYGRWSGLTITTKQGALKVRGSGDSPLRVEVTLGDLALYEVER